MKTKIKNLLKPNCVKSISFCKVQEGAINQMVIKKYQADPDFPYLVSFPRTGSHWFRMILELYTDCPLLVRTFFNHNNNNYLLLHTHDMNLTEQRKNVVYLYRYPTDVIYSQINYYKQNFRNKIYVLFWSNQYALHLSHWLYNEKFAEKKTVIFYDGLKNNIEVEFKKVCKHFDVTFDANRLHQIAQKITKDQVSQKTAYDSQIINKRKNYINNREWFKKEYDALIMEILSQVSVWSLGNKNELIQLFNY